MTKCPDSKKTSAMVQFRTQRVGNLGRFMQLKPEDGCDDATPDVRLCVHDDCQKPVPSVRQGRFCHSHKTRKLCASDGCERHAKCPSPWCWMHGDKAKCPVDACERYQQWGLTTCLRHSVNRCDVPGCDSAAAPPSIHRCAKHGGSYRCQSEACSVYEVPPAAYHRSGNLRVCWPCFASLEPSKAKLKVRSEHYIIDELIRRMPELLGKARQAVWDCPVPGGCSLKRPDLLYILEDRYLQVEIDERGHASYDCSDEDARLEIIAADVGLPGMVLRLNPDAPPCFGPKRLCNGEQALQIRDRAAFTKLMDETCCTIETYLSCPPPPSVIRVNVPKVV